MSPAWIIMKASRSKPDFTVNESSAYCGPAAESAGIPMGQVYSSVEQARADAKKLSSVNPVGFHVVQIR